MLKAAGVVCGGGLGSSLLAGEAAAASPAFGIEFSRTYGGVETETFGALVQAADGYALFGTCYAGESPWLVKTNESGDVQWARTYGDQNSREQAMDMVETADGGYLLLTVRFAEDDGNIGRNARLVKVTESGDVEWTETYSGTSVSPVSLIRTRDGGYAFAGYEMSDTVSEGNYTDALLVKVDGHGDVEFRRTYDVKSEDTAFSLIQTSDGGYAMIGSTSPTVVPDEGSVLLIKTDAGGETEFVRSYNKRERTDTRTGSVDWGTALVETSDGYLFGAQTEYAPWLVKLGSRGDVQWERTDVDGISELIRVEGGYVAGGIKAGSQAVVQKIDDTGEVQVSREYGGEGRDYLSDLIRTSDGGYAFAGGTQNAPQRDDGVERDFDGWFVKLGGSEA